MGKPQPADDLDGNRLGANGFEIARQFKQYRMESTRQGTCRQSEYMAIVNRFAKRLQRKSITDRSFILQELVNVSPLLECVYLLNEQGVQISDTVFQHHRQGLRSGRQIFQPATPGQDHSVKDYYYLLAENDTELHITAPYLSWATGTLCVTASTIIQDEKDKNIILCVDLACSE